MKRVAVGLSGGVDSAVSAWLLKEAGFDVVGVHLYCWPPKSEIEKDGLTREEWIKKNGCKADEDRQMALKTALELGIPFKVLDFSEEYNQRVIKYFYDEYEAGRTPNPDVLCNSEIKFGLFLDWALENGFDYVATGHYSKLSVTEDGLRHSYHLLIPEDKHKDQTYFLWKLTQKELSHVLFPLGDYEKSEVREMAKKAGLSVADRKDSQGICFVGNVEVKEFLARRLVKKPGTVVDIEGSEVGTHDGVWFYTIGERGGWKWLPKAQKKYMKDGETPTMFVVEKRAEENVLVVARTEDATKNSFVVENVNWLCDTVPQLHGVTVRIRHGGELMGARVGFGSVRLPHPDGIGVRNDGEVAVVLDKKVRGIASGQSAVFYSNEGEVLGGGVIR